MPDPQPALTPLDLPARGGSLAIFEIGDGRRRIEARLDDPAMSLDRRECETRYPVDLIRRMLDVRGAQWIVDEVAREEDPLYIERPLQQVLLAYLPVSEFQNKTMLDFGCGMGASTVVLSRLFPTACIVGIELLAEHVALAAERARVCGSSNVSFQVSPAPDKLPPDLPALDFIILSAVHEHLLPNERRTLYPMLWNALKPGGVMFVDQTPERYFPIEAHTTGWPLINYLPLWLVQPLATRFCPRVARGTTREGLLRYGLRGGTAREILRLIPDSGGRPELLQPSQAGMRDRIDLWYSHKPASGKRRLLRSVYKAVKLATGVTFLPSLSLAIRKPSD